MPSKICSFCRQEKDYSCFSPSASNKGGVASICRECVNDKRLSEKTRKDREERALLASKGLKKCAYCKEVKEFISFRTSNRRKDGYRPYCRECENKKSKEHDNRPEVKERRHNRDKLPEVVEWRREYRQTSEKFKKTQEKYENSEKRKNWTKEYRAEVNKNLELRLRCRIYDALMKGGGLKKQMHFIDLVGCSMELFKKHIESQWTDGMSWDNYTHSGWHIDHVIPCKAFDLSEPIQQLACFNWKNCSPLWGKDNLMKSGSFNPIEYERYLSEFKAEYLSQNNSLSL